MPIRDRTLYALLAAFATVLGFVVLNHEAVCRFFGDCILCGNFYVKQCMFLPNPQRVTLGPSQHAPVYGNIVLKLEGISDRMVKTTIVDTVQGRTERQPIEYKPVGDIVANHYDGCNLVVRLVELSDSNKATFEMQCR